MNDRKPVSVFCLAEIVSDELMARKWTTRTLAARISDKENYQIKVLALDIFLANGSNDGILLTDKDFNDFAKAFGISKEYFENVHKAWLKNPSWREPFECPEEVLSAF